MTDDEIRANLRPHGNVRRIGPVDAVSVKCAAGRHDECSGSRLRWDVEVATFSLCECACHGAGLRAAA